MEQLQIRKKFLQRVYAKRELGKQTLGSVLVANGIPVMTTALPAWSAKSNPSLT